jgi:hypothetical protein
LLISFLPRFEVFMAVKIEIDVFWVVTPCSEDGGSRKL